MQLYHCLWKCIRKRSRIYENRTILYEKRQITKCVLMKLQLKSKKYKRYHMVLMFSGIHISRNRLLHMSSDKFRSKKIFKILGFIAQE